MTTPNPTDLRAVAEAMRNQPDRVVRAMARRSVRATLDTLLVQDAVQLEYLLGMVIAGMGTRRRLRSLERRRSR